MTGLSLPLRATMTGGRTPERYCSPCLDLWQYGRTENDRSTMHPTCRAVLEEIRSGVPLAVAS